MNIIYISDFFVDQIAGGGELVDDCLIKHLISRGFSVSRINSDKANLVFLQKNKENFLKKMIGKYLMLHNQHIIHLLLYVTHLFGFL